MRRIITLILAAATLAALAAPAVAKPGQLDGRLYAGGEIFRTKDAADIPPPTGNNAHSFDAIHPFAGAAHADQLPVAEAAPGQPGFNGGRWAARPVAWTTDGIAAHPGGLPLVTDSATLYELIGLGYIEYVTAHPVAYFECPVVPVPG